MKKVKESYRKKTKEGRYLSFLWDQNFNSVSPVRDEISARFRMTKFLHC